MNRSLYFLLFVIFGLGDNEINAQDSPMPNGLTEVCPGASFSYWVFINSCYDNHNWTITPPIGTVVGSPTHIAEVQWELPGVAQLCLVVDDICNGGTTLNQTCITVTSSPIPPTQENHDLCLGQTVICADQMFSSGGSFDVPLVSYLGCDSIVTCIITPIIIPPTVLNPITVCGPASFDFCGNTYNSSGVFAPTCTNYQGCDSVLTVDLAILEPVAHIVQPPLVDFSITPTIFLDGSNSTINLVPNGTTTYNWTGPGIVGPTDQNSLEINMAGQYCLELTHERDLVVCSDVVCINVCEGAIIDSITPDTVVCGPNTIQLEVVAPTAVSYEWSPTGSLSCWDCPNPEAFPVHSDEYFVIVTDANGCTEQASVFLDVRFGLDWGLQPWSNSPVCEGDSIELFTLFPSNIVEYNWTGPDNFSSTEPMPVIQNASALHEGTYYVTLVDDAGCEANADFFVDVLENLGNTITIGPDPPILNCLGTILSPSSFPPGAFYLWEGPCILSNPGGSSIDIGCLGTYILTVTSPAGCYDSDTLVVTEILQDEIAPEVSVFVPDILTCAVNEITLDGQGSSQGPNYIYEWTTLNGNILTAPNQLSIVVNQPGLYQLTVIDISNGCSASELVEVTQDVELPAISLSPSIQICEGSDFEFCHPFLPGVVNYTWNTPNGIINDPCISLFDISPADAGLYCLFITDAMNGCTAEACMEIEVLPTPEIVWISNDTTVCKDETVTLNVLATPPATYQWTPAVNLSDPNIANPIAQVTNTITYVVLVIDQNGCVAQDSVTITINEDCVWPGDTDSNGVVNNFDLLNIGLAYDSIGPLRPNASLNWHPQIAPEWTQSIDPPGINFKHIDTNGEGIINSEDTLAITLNWGQTHNFTDPIPEEDKNMGAPFYIQPDTLQPDTSYALSIILGDQIEPANNVYGLAFSITYDPAMIIANGASASFGNSWLGNLDANMIAIHKWFSAEGRVDIGITRTDGMNMDGMGEIGTFYISIEDIIFFNNPDVDDKSEELVFKIENVKVINFKNEEIPVDTEPEPFIVNNTRQLDLTQFITVFPNPTDEMLQVVAKDIVLEKVELFNITGQLQMEKRLNNSFTSLNTSALDEGTYLLRIWTKEGVLVERVVIF